ncbi:MAG: acyl carrier protein [Flavobacteriaceae bacterium]
MTDRIIAYIKEEISLEPIDEIDLDEDLLGSGILDSLGVMKLVAFLEEEYSIKIMPEDMTVENFSTLRTITDFISKQG